MAKVFDGKKEAADVIRSGKALHGIGASASGRKETLVRSLKLVAIRMTEDPAADIFISEKRKTAETLGIKLEELKILPKETTVLGTFERLNQDQTVDGYYVQLPVPRFKPEWWKAVDIRKDVEGLGADAMERLETGTELVIPPTPMAVLHTLGVALNTPPEKLELSGKNIVLISRSRLIGIPLLYLLTRQSATVTVCDRETKDISEHTIKADILITGTGKPGLITGEMVKPGVVAIDLGTKVVKENGKNKVIGDLDYASVSDKASFITPPVGGLGPLVVAYLLKNLVKLATLQAQTR